MSQRKFPPYTHIPGQTPHPISDPAGHMYSNSGDVSVSHRLLKDGVPLSLQTLLTCDAFQWGVALFNAGYYWEAHEEWESLWHDVGRSGPLASFLKGLIKLAAAGVKLREHNLDGVGRHARRAGELFDEVVCSMSSNDSKDEAELFSRLINSANRLAESPPPLPNDRYGKPLSILGDLPITTTEQSVDWAKNINQGRSVSAS